MLAATAAIIGFGVGPSMHGTCGSGLSACVLPVGPGGQEVTDSFYFVHQSLDGDGSITARITSLTGLIPTAATGRDGPSGDRPGVVPWAKAGLIIKASTRSGSAYAAMMVTGGHGVRMQYDYTEDIAGRSGAASPTSPRWLRLTRTGDAVTGAESTDGLHWTTVGTAHLKGLPTTVDAGLFATSPQYSATTGGPLGAAGVEGGPTQDTGAFDSLGRDGTWPDQSWSGTAIGGPDNVDEQRHGAFQQTAHGFTVTGSGDIAPSVAGASGIGTTITQTLVGTFVGLTIVVIVAVMFITAEYRRGLIRITLAAIPHRGRVLAAKATVLAAVAFLAGLIAATVVVAVGQRVLRANGVYVHPATIGTEIRVVVGTAVLARRHGGPRDGHRIGCAPERYCCRQCHRRDRRAVPVGHRVPTGRRGAVAAAGHPGRSICRAADGRAISAGRQHLYTGRGLLPAEPVGGNRRTGRLGRFHVRARGHS